MKTPPPFSNEVILFMNYYNNIQKDQTKQKKKKEASGKLFLQHGKMVHTHTVCRLLQFITVPSFLGRSM